MNATNTIIIENGDEDAPLVGAGLETGDEVGAAVALLLSSVISMPEKHVH